MKNLLPIIFGFATIMMNFLQAEMQIPIIPSPREVEWRDGAFRLGDSIAVFYSENIHAGFSGLPILKEFLGERSMFQSFTGEPDARSGEPGIHILLTQSEEFSVAGETFRFSPEMIPEGYFLMIQSKRVLLFAQEEAGLFYGIMSLLQIWERFSREGIPGMVIKDYPAFSWRGVSDDISRGQVSTMDNFKDIIRFLARYKYNIYMPYMEDVMVLDTYPDIAVGRGALTKNELVELQTFADRYYVQIIPIFQTLGHYENILNMPEYQKYAEYPGAASLNISSKAADAFLFNMLEEVMPVFRSPYFHIGADESWDVGLGATRKLKNEIGIAELHARHYNKVYEKVRKADRKVLMYGDIILRHPEILERIPKDIIIVDWHYWPTDSYPSVKRFREAGFQVLVSPGIHNWRRPFPNLNSAWINIANFNRRGQEEGALGSILSNWGDYGGPNFRELNYLGYIYGSETSWSPTVTDKYTLDGRYFWQYFGTDDSRLQSLFLHLSEIAGLSDFKQIWAQPFYEPTQKPNELLAQSSQLLDYSRAACDIIDELREIVPRNSDYLDYLENAALMGEYLGHKMVLARDRQIILTETLTDTQSAELDWDLKDGCLSQIGLLAQIEEQYQTLWLRTNRPDNLTRVLNLFRHQKAYYAESYAQLTDKHHDFPMEVPSKWITANRFTTDTTNPTVYLRKTFMLPANKRIQSADLQIVANTNATIFVNGKKIGKVVATKSLSLLAENQRVGWWKIKEQLADGENCLTVEVSNYIPERPAAANVYLEIYFEDDAVLIVGSDPTWEAAIVPSKKWQTVDFAESWGKAAEYSACPWKISVPLFKRGYASRVEF